MIQLVLAAAAVAAGSPEASPRIVWRGVPVFTRNEKAAANVAAQTAAEVRAADRAFAAEAQAKGTAAAFRDWMDPLEGRVHGGPQPMVGAAQIFAGFGGDAPSRVTLEWAPTGAWGSVGNDMGVTTGDWRRTPGDAAKPVTTGRYVTVWHKTAAGQWRGLIDIGEVDDKPRANAVGTPTR